ncbi:unnamed protein product [Trichogramma brassicae]|uniref:Netrin module non-TIMP type domain-containing protein n=1 Tax=Trichogramma brassicae TaxID=86971 RepID=A0A6H5J8N5_9HYME|nr:unnamed protein product [Trichogramma brassicae]
MIVIEQLEEKGYELDRNDALTIMKFFDKLKLFPKLADLENNWYDDIVFVIEAYKIMIKSSLSLNDLIKLRPNEASKLLTYKDYREFARSNEFSVLPERYRDDCALHLCEKLLRRFFRDWVLDCFYDLIHKRLPVSTSRFRESNARQRQLKVQAVAACEYTFFAAPYVHVRDAANRRARAATPVAATAATVRAVMRRPMPAKTDPTQVLELAPARELLSGLVSLGTPCVAQYKEEEAILRFDFLWPRASKLFRKRLNSRNVYCVYATYMHHIPIQNMRVDDVSDVGNSLIIVYTNAMHRTESWHDRISLWPVLRDHFFVSFLKRDCNPSTTVLRSDPLCASRSLYMVLNNLEKSRAPSSYCTKYQRVASVESTYRMYRYTLYIVQSRRTSVSIMCIVYTRLILTPDLRPLYQIFPMKMENFGKSDHTIGKLSKGPSRDSKNSHKSIFLHVLHSRVTFISFASNFYIRTRADAHTHPPHEEAFFSRILFFFHFDSCAPRSAVLRCLSVHIVSREPRPYFHPKNGLPVGFPVPVHGNCHLHHQVHNDVEEKRKKRRERYSRDDGSVITSCRVSFAGESMRLYTYHCGAQREQLRARLYTFRYRHAGESITDADKTRRRSVSRAARESSRVAARMDVGPFQDTATSSSYSPLLIRVTDRFKKVADSPSAVSGGPANSWVRFTVNVMMIYKRNRDSRIVRGPTPLYVQSADLACRCPKIKPNQLQNYNF